MMFKHSQTYRFAIRFPTNILCKRSVCVTLICATFIKSFLYDRGEILHRVRKILPIYRSMLHCVGVRYFPTASPLYIGEFLHTTKLLYIEEDNPNSVKLYITMCVFVCASVNALSLCVCLCVCCVLAACLSVCVCVHVCLSRCMLCVYFCLFCFICNTMFMCDNTINELVITPKASMPLILRCKHGEYK